MPRYALKIQYDGTNYVGYQVQPNGPTIQASIEKALKVMAKLPKDQMIPTSTSGRTDSGVHALGQVIHVDYPFSIHPQGMRKGLNSILETSIRVLEVVEVDEAFHARYSAVGKEYQYRVDIQEYPDPFKRNYTLHHPYRFDLQKLQKAIKTIVGEHDFTSFCSTKTDKEDKVREIYEAEVWLDDAKDELVFRFYGKGFLYNMIRILVGTLLQIGDGLRPVNDLERILALKDRNIAGPTASPSGLYLVYVEYSPNPFLTDKN